MQHPTTSFAPAERASLETVQNQRHFIEEFPYIRKMLNSVPLMAVVLNPQRQIVFANQAFVSFLGNCNDLAKQCSDISANKRFGEALSCVHSNESPGGCGTSAACRACGAVQAILGSQTGDEVQKECRMLRHPGEQTEALDLRVTASPLIIKDQSFTILTLVDISDEKRRQALERIFFHDILNTAGAVQGLAAMLAGMDIKEDEIRSIAELLQFSSDQLIDEISAQRTLNSAERNDLKVSLDKVPLAPFLQRIAGNFAAHTVARNRFTKVAGEVQNLSIETDPNLLARVVQNLTKNALEASNPGDTVTLNAQSKDGKAVISVHNPTFMTEDVRTQVFNRSFSTRGPGRGLGTYSVKLLSERYLKGMVSFDSVPGAGTTFYVTLPMVRPDHHG